MTLDELADIDYEMIAVSKESLVAFREERDHLRKELDQVRVSRDLFAHLSQTMHDHLTNGLIHEPLPASDPSGPRG